MEEVKTPSLQAFAVLVAYIADMATVNPQPECQQSPYDMAVEAMKLQPLRPALCHFLFPTKEERVTQVALTLAYSLSGLKDTKVFQHEWLPNNLKTYQTIYEYVNQTLSEEPKL